MARTVSSSGKRLRDTSKDTLRTAGQVVTVNSFDSELARNSTYALTSTRVREIILDPTVQLARQAVVSPMIHTPWEYTEKEGAPSGAADFVRKSFEPLRDWFIQNAIYGALDHGWQPFEIVYELVDGENRIKEFKQLLQQLTCILVYVDSGRFAGFINEPVITDVIPLSTEIRTPYALNINLAYEGTDWYGISVSAVLDPIMTYWEDVNNTNNRFDKKIAGATWVVYYPVGETMFNGKMTDNDTIARTLLNTLEASGGVAIPDEVQEWLDDSVDRELKGKWRIELISAQGSISTNFVDRMKYLDNLKLRAFGIPERAILEGKFGTKAEAETHADMALMTIDTKHRLLCDQLNDYVVRPLLRFQYGPEAEQSVQVHPAPLVDAQFQTVKEVYRMLLQNQRIVEREVENIDVPSLRNQVGIPEINGAPNDFSDLEPEMPTNPLFGQGDDEEEEDDEENKDADDQDGDD